MTEQLSRIDLVAIGERLRSARQMKGLTLDDVAAAVPMNQSYLSQIENGKRTPTIPMIERIAEVVGLSAPEAFFGRLGPTGGAKLAAVDMYLTDRGGDDASSYYLERDEVFFEPILEDEPIVTLKAVLHKPLVLISPHGERSIESGDTLIVCTNRLPEDGDIVLAMFEQDEPWDTGPVQHIAVWREIEGHAFLWPAKPRKPVLVDSDQAYGTIGLVTEIRRPMTRRRLDQIPMDSTNSAFRTRNG